MPNIPLLPTATTIDDNDTATCRHPAVADAVAASSQALAVDVDICFCAADDISMELIEMKCCKKNIHRLCLVAWLATSNHCVHCRGEVTMEEVFDYPAIS